MLSWFSDDIDGWHMHLKEKGVKKVAAYYLK